MNYEFCDPSIERNAFPISGSAHKLYTPLKGGKACRRASMYPTSATNISTRRARFPFLYIYIYIPSPPLFQPDRYQLRDNFPSGANDSQRLFEISRYRARKKKSRKNWHSNRIYFKLATSWLAIDDTCIIYNRFEPGQKKKKKSFI